MPPDFKFVPCSDNNYETRDKFIKDPSVASSMLLEGLIKVGGVFFSVSKKSDGLYYTSDDPVGRSKVATILKLVYKQDLREKAASALLNDVDENHRVKTLLIDPLTKFKLAAAQIDPRMAQMQPGQPPPQQGQQPPQPGQQPAPGEDPAMMDPAMMDPSMQMAPPMPSPVDMAIQEVHEKLTALHEEKQKAVQQQIESLQTQLQALEAVGARTQEIEQGIAKEESPAFQQIEPMDPSMMQQSSEVSDPAVFDTSMISSLANSATLSDAVIAYVPTLMKSLDHLGRILLTYWIKGPDLKQELGDEKYHGLEDKIRNIFKGVGDLILNVHQNALMVRKTDEFSTQANE